MKLALKAEFKKLLTVRSTYLLVIFALLLTGLFTYLNTGPMVYEEPKEPPAVSEQPPARDAPPEEVVLKVTRNLPKDKLLTNLQDMVPVVSLFFAIAVVLLMAHEFRYNTITYTLTASNSRSKVLLSKVITSAVFIIIATLLALGVAVAATYAAVSIRDLNLLPQDSYNWAYIITRLVGYTLGFALFGLAIITLVRNTIIGVVALLVLPMMDGIVGALLKNWKDIEAAQALPLSALSRVSTVAPDFVAGDKAPVTVLNGVVVFVAYLAVLWAVSWYLFLRRDAA